MRLQQVETHVGARGCGAGGSVGGGVVGVGDKNQEMFVACCGWRAAALLALSCALH